MEEGTGGRVEGTPRLLGEAGTERGGLQLAGGGVPGQGWTLALALPGQLFYFRLVAPPLGNSQRALGNPDAQVLGGPALCALPPSEGCTPGRHTAGVKVTSFPRLCVPIENFPTS